MQQMASLIAQLVKNPPAMQEAPVRFLGQEDPLRRDRLPTPVFLDFSSSSAGKESACNVGDLGLIPGLGRFPWRRERLPTPVFLDFPNSSAGKEPACNVGNLGLIPGLRRFPWRRERLPSPVFWPGEFHGLPRVRHKWATFTSFHTGDVGFIPESGRCFGEGNSNPIRYSCLGNPTNRTAWWVGSWGCKRVRHNLATKQQYYI